MKYNSKGEQVVAVQSTVINEIAVDIMRLSSTDVATNYNSTAQAVSWDTEDIPATGASMSWAPGADTRFTIETAGSFQLIAQMAFTSVAQMVNVKVYFRKNGTTALPGFVTAFIRGASGHNQAGVPLFIVDQFVATDYIEVMCVQEAASGTVNLISGDSIFFGQKLGVDP